MWTCLQATDDALIHFPAIVYCPRINLAPDGRYSGRLRDGSRWANRVPGQRLCIGVRESAQCDFPISALNVCETLRDTWPCRAPFDVRFRRRRALRFLAHRERPIHLSKFSALAALSRGFCNGCKASELFRLGAIIIYLRPQRIDSRCPLQRLTQCMTKWGSTGSRSGTARPFPLWRLRSSPHSPPIDPITRK